MADALPDFDDDEFESAGSMSQLDYSDILEHTVLLQVVEIRPEVETKEYGTAYYVPEVDLVDLDTGSVYEGVLMFGQILSTQLKRKVGKKVLGVFSQGEAKGKKSAPWTLLAMTEEDKAKAAKWKAAGGSFSASAAPSTATGGAPPF